MTAASNSKDIYSHAGKENCAPTIIGGGGHEILWIFGEVVF